MKVYYNDGNFTAGEELEILRGLAFNEITDYDLAMQYAQELIKLSEEKNDFIYLHRGYLQKGSISRLQGNLDIAIESLFRSVEAAQKADYPEGVGGAYINIADIYSINGNSRNAILHYNLAIEILRNSSDTITLATALLNAGDEYFRSGAYDSALIYFAESGELFEKVDYQAGIAYNLGNIGMVYAEQGADEIAKSHINQAIGILEELGDYYAISDYLTYMSDIYFRQNDWSAAVSYAQKSLELGHRYGLKEQISDANLQLANLYEERENLLKAYQYYKEHILYRDSVNNIQTVQQIADLRTDFEIAQKQIEVDLLNQQKKNQQIVVIATGIALVLIILLALGLYQRYRYVSKTNKIIEQEKNRSESLLLNILPKETAEELKLYGKVEAKRFESVTVLFTDFKGFTTYAEKLSPEALVKSIDFYFSKFDDIIEKYQLEKIKTVGDAYMCAGGLPFPSEDHAQRMMLAAFEIADFVDKSKVMDNGHTPFDIRIGINTGPVVAGVVGSKKFAYDIWGDTVNIASRMESGSEPGKINISQYTYMLVKDFVACDFRGEIKVKNRGALKMYFVQRPPVLPEI